MAEIKELNDNNFESSLSEQDLAFVDIYADWCGSCRLFFKTFDEVASNTSNAAFFKIEGEENEKFRDSLEIPNLPYVAAFSKGKFIDGVSTAKKEGLEAFINSVREKLQ